MGVVSCVKVIAVGEEDAADPPAFRVAIPVVASLDVAPCHSTLVAVAVRDAMNYV